MTDMVAQEEILSALRTAIIEIETGKARGCFVALIGPEDEDRLAISGCLPQVRDLMITEAREMLASIEAKHEANKN